MLGSLVEPGAFSFQGYNRLVEKRIPDLESLETEARSLVASLAPTTHALLVTLSGELGAGKTTFTQLVARALGIDEPVTSPTFVLEKIYELEGQAFARLVHIDAYRLEGGQALKPLGFDDLYADPNNLILLEWPERVTDALPTADISITLIANDDGSRIMTYG